MDERVNELYNEIEAFTNEVCVENKHIYTLDEEYLKKKLKEVVEVGSDIYLTKAHLYEIVVGAYTSGDRYYTNHIVMYLRDMVFDTEDCLVFTNLAHYFEILANNFAFRHDNEAHYVKRFNLLTTDFEKALVEKYNYYCQYIKNNPDLEDIDFILNTLISYIFGHINFMHLL